MTTTNPTTDPAEFSERRTWRDALDSLMALVRRGEDVDPAELADTRAKADAEVEVETGRKSKHERKRAEQEQAAATARADELVAQMDPDIRGTVEAEIDEAWLRYLAAVEAAHARYVDHTAQVDELAREVRKTGVPIVPGDAQTNRLTRITGDRLVTSPGGSSTPTWRGVTYNRVQVTGNKLPHATDQSARRRQIDQMRGRMT